MFDASPCRSGHLRVHSSRADDILTVLYILVFKKELYGKAYAEGEEGRILRYDVLQTFVLSSRYLPPLSLSGGCLLPAL